MLDPVLCGLRKAVLVLRARPSSLPPDVFFFDFCHISFLFVQNQLWFFTSLLPTVKVESAPHPFLPVLFLPFSLYRDDPVRRPVSLPFSSNRCFFIPMLSPTFLILASAVLCFVCMLNKLSFFLVVWYDNAGSFSMTSFSWSFHPYCH